MKSCEVIQRNRKFTYKMVHTALSRVNEHKDLGVVIRDLKFSKKNISSHVLQLKKCLVLLRTILYIKVKTLFSII